MKTILTSTDGLVDVDIMADEVYKKYQIVPIKDKISRSGLTVEQVNKILYLAFEGMEIAVKDTTKANHQIPIFVTLSESTKVFQLAL